MDDINGMLGSILGDPESMKQIKELADMLRSEVSDDAAANTSEGGELPPQGMDLSALAGLLGAESGLNTEMLSMIGTLMSAAGGDDKNRALLMALRPHLSSEKQARLDKAVKMLRIYSLAEAMKNSGLLGKLDKLI